MCTQCTFQSALCIASARRRYEKGKRIKNGERTRTTVKNATGVHRLPYVGVCTGCVGRGGSASAGALTTQSACERRGRASGKSWLRHNYISRKRCAREREERRNIAAL